MFKLHHKVIKPESRRKNPLRLPGPPKMACYWGPLVLLGEGGRSRCWGTPPAIRSLYKAHLKDTCFHINDFNIIKCSCLTIGVLTSASWNKTNPYTDSWTSHSRMSITIFKPSSVFTHVQHRAVIRITIIGDVLWVFRNCHLWK